MIDHLLPTTLAGGLPKPAWLAQPLTLWAPWTLDGEALAEAKRDAVRQVLQYVAPEHLQPCTNCGMVPLSRPVALGKLKALAAGAALIRRELA